MTNLDRRLKMQRAAAVDATVAFDGDAEVGEARLEVASELDSPLVPAGAVGARDELALAEGLVDDDLATEADRAE